MRPKFTKRSIKTSIGKEKARLDVLESVFSFSFGMVKSSHLLVEMSIN